MGNLTRGMIAGLVGTLVMSLLIIMKEAAGIMPQMSIIAMLSSMLDSPPVMGWIAHLTIGTVFWGGLYGALYYRMPGRTSVNKGLLLAGVAWLAMMVFVMPLAGAGLFGLAIGIEAPLATLIMHLVYGATLGTTYSGLEPRATVHA